MLLTNGGGVTETRKAELLTKKLNINVPAERIVQSHTPFRTLVDKYKNELVLVIGSVEAKNIAEHYGFEKVITTGE